MKRQVAIILTVVVVTVGAPRSALGQDGYVDAVAAVVGDKVITVYDLHRETRLAEQQLRGRHTGEELQKRIVELRRDAANRLIEEELLYSEFTELGGQVPPAYLQSRLDQVVLAQSGGNREQFESRLLEQGLTMREFEARLERRAAVDLLLQDRVYRSIHIAPDQIERYYRTHSDEYRREHRIRLQAIVLKPDGRYAGRLDAGMAAIRAQLDGGAEFDKVAAEYSEDGSAASGGDLGWIEVSKANPALVQAVAGLEPGQVAAPLQLGGALYLLRLREEDKGGERALDEELRAEIEATLAEAEGARRHREYVNKLRQKFYVRTFF